MSKKNRRKMRKALATMLAALLLVVVSVGATLAYLQDDTEAVVNTFTTGKVKITLDEKNVDGDTVTDKDGKTITPERDMANEYKIFPGGTYEKDPMVTVEKNSEKAYVRMTVEVSDIEKLKAAFPEENYKNYYNGEVFLLQMLVGGWDNAIWTPTDATADGKYEFTYYQAVTTADDTDATTEGIQLDKLFETITIPTTVDNDAIANLNEIKINVKAYAVQEDGFNTADAAFTAAWPEIFPAA